MTAPSPADRAVKRTRILDILDNLDIDALLLTSHSAIAWYLDGARTHTSLLGDPVLAVRVDRDGDTVAVYSNEADRLAAEELPAGISLTTVQWDGSLLAALGAGGAPGTGPRITREADAAVQLRAARASLLPAELARYQTLSGDAAVAVTDVLTDVARHSSERSLAAAIGSALIERGIDPAVILVAGESRLGLRHPLPTDGPLGGRIMVVVCGRRHGLVTNLTRWVSTRPPTTREIDSQDRIFEVEAGYFAATISGATLADVFAAGTSGYARWGFDPDEWRNHHQGGAAGYNGRDPRATALVTDTVVENQAFAWNPSAPGAKVEDTVMTSSQGMTVLTADPRWPTRVVAALPRPLELRL